MSVLNFTARAYAPNSPHAAGRLVALALIANGEIKETEWAVLHGLQACEQLGLSQGEWHDIVDGLCEDLLAGAIPGGSCVIDQHMLDDWLAEVSDPELQHRVIRLCADVIAADGYVEHGESVVLRCALERWVLPVEEQARMEPMLYGLDFQVVPRQSCAASGPAHGAHV
ncbi:TerB family tellurite resistance protein [Azohydromonas aeria]|uniref:TerB family tellurite resistance protein n=1 Tax=Azohydromonas aeria TaxID=2590212 RepID=UPI0012FC640D|nr:TerB family tellurite resistance protein [Azohydromonas aeria]